MRVPVLLALGTLLAPRVALALSCVPCPIQIAPRNPEIFSENTRPLSVPPNFEIRMLSREGGQPPELTLGGDPVAVTCTAIPELTDRYTSCRPQTMPAVGETLRLDTIDGRDIDLRIGGEVDDTPPETVRVDHISWRRTERDLSDVFQRERFDFDDARGVEFTVRTAEAIDGVTFEVEIRGEDGVLSTVALSGETTGLFDGRFFLGVAVCSCPEVTFKEDALPDEATFRIRAVDSAGNRGPWSNVTVPDNAPGCRCVTPPGTPDPSLALVFVLALGVLRRRAG